VLRPGYLADRIFRRVLRHRLLQRDIFHERLKSDKARAAFVAFMTRKKA
jgi:hypothetical protein